MVISYLIDILLAEHYLEEIQLITEVLEETVVNPKILSTRDGIETIKLIRNEPPYQDASRPPAIIILDLNPLRRDGQNVLAEIKPDPTLGVIPELIFSGSDAPQEVSACYSLHDNWYIVKPSHLFGLTETIRSLEDFCLMKVKLPPDPRPDKGSEKKNAN